MNGRNEDQVPYEYKHVDHSIVSIFAVSLVMIGAALAGVSVIV